MTLTSENTDAENGVRVHSIVQVNIDAVGVDPTPFDVVVYAGACAMHRSRYASRAEADTVREGMHAYYMRVHRGEVDAV